MLDAEAQTDGVERDAHREQKADTAEMVKKASFPKAMEKVTETANKEENNYVEEKGKSREYDKKKAVDTKSTEKDNEQPFSFNPCDAELKRKCICSFFVCTDGSGDEAE